jgi:uncharacterized protein (DUF885 family)
MPRSTAVNKWRWFILALIFGLLVGCASPTPAPPADISTLDGLLMDLRGLDAAAFMAEGFRVLMLRTPQTLTALGLSGLYGVGDDGLDSYDPGDRLLTQELESALLDQAQSYDSSALDGDTRRDLAAFIWYLQGRVALHSYQWFDLPLLNETGFLTDQYVHLLMAQQPFEDAADVEDYLARLEAIGPQIDGIIQYLADRQDAGLRIPAAVYTAVMEELGAHRWQVGRKTPFITVLAVRLQNMSEIDRDARQAYYERGSRIADEMILPAFERLMDMLYDLADTTTSEFGLLDQPDGLAYYEALLRQVTTLARSPEDWHLAAQAELTRLQNEARLAAAEAGYDPSLPLQEIFRQATVDRRYALGLDIFATLRSLLIEVETSMDAVLEIDFENDLVMVPVFEGAYYEPAALDGSRRAVLYAGFTGREAYFDMPTRVYHETFPGRHFLASAVQAQNLPLYRQAMHFPAFDAGWARYAEGLAWEMGMYVDDPNANLGRLQQALLSAAQVVADTGLHAYGWSEQEAARYLVEMAGIDRSEANDLVLLQIAQPGQALAGFAGESFIREMRDAVQESLGADFDLKTFHSALLSGGNLPLPMLAEQVREELDF